MKFKQQITAKFECKDLGELDKILNMEVTRTVEGGLCLSHCMSRMSSRNSSSTYRRRGPSLMMLRL